MANSNEEIMIQKILKSELTIRRASKQFGLRRDDFIMRLRLALGDDKESLKQLDLVIMINKMLFDDVSIETVADQLGLSVDELDQKILKQLENNEDKLERYLEYKRVHNMIRKKKRGNN